MRSQKEPDGLLQNVRAPGQWTVPGQPGVKRAEDRRTGDTVAVGFSRRAEPGVKAWGNVFRMGDPYGPGQAGIEGGGP